MDDTYNTIQEPSQGLFKQQSSRFLAFAYPVSGVDQVKELVGALKSEYYDARHWCYAYRIGSQGQLSRANDDGEPSGTAGRPILGQLLARGLTNTLVVVVRYFGGIKLGVSGLIEAYKTATADALDRATVVERTRQCEVTINFPYLAINQVMKALKDSSATIKNQQFDNACSITLAIRHGDERRLLGQIEEIEFAQITHQGYNIE